MYIAYQGSNKYIKICKQDEASYTPPGWHKPYNYSTLDNISKTKVNPAEKKGARVHLPSLVTHANNVRVVSEKIEQQINDIDAQIVNLQKLRRSIIDDNFLTFRLVQENDLKRSYEEVFVTKSAAEGKE